MAKTIATIEGTALVPGISKNGRYYSPEAIAKAVARLSERIATGTNPAVMLTSHGADDDSRCIVGLLSSVALADDGSARFSAQIADTDEGRKIASLVDPRGAPAFLKGVSIRGAWIGKVQRRISPDGRPYEEAPDLEIDGLDFTRKPGVPGAEIDTFTPAAASAPAETAPGGRVLITESVQEALVQTTATEADQAGELGVSAGQFADHGYNGQPRLPVGSRGQAKASWLALSESETARQYTAAQLKRVRQRVTKALRSFGVQVVAQEGWLIDPAVQVTEAVAECLGYSEDPGHGGSMCITLTNGPTTVTVSSYCVDPHDLEAVGRAAMTGACQAVAVLDPDMDADIDVPGAEPEDTDGDMSTETVATESTPSTQTPAPVTPAAVSTQEKEPAMAESTNPAAQTPGSDSGLEALAAKFDKLTDLIGGLVTAMTPVAATESAPAAPAVVEAAPVVAEVTETEDQRITRLVTAGIKAALPAAVQEHVETTGGPSRKGLVESVTETAAAPAVPGLPEGAPTKPLHEYSQDEWRAHIAPIVTGAVFKGRGEA